MHTILWAQGCLVFVGCPFRKSFPPGHWRLSPVVSNFGAYECSSQKLSFWSLASLFIFLQFRCLWVFFAAFCPPGRWRLSLDASILTPVSFLDTGPACRRRNPQTVEALGFDEHLKSVAKCLVGTLNLIPLCGGASSARCSSVVSITGKVPIWGSITKSTQRWPIRCRSLWVLPRL